MYINNSYSQIKKCCNQFLVIEAFFIRDKKKSVLYVTYTKFLEKSQPVDKMIKIYEQIR